MPCDVVGVLRSPVEAPLPRILEFQFEVARNSLWPEFGKLGRMPGYPSSETHNSSHLMKLKISIASLMLGAAVAAQAQATGGGGGGTSGGGSAGGGGAGGASAGGTGGASQTE